jgi:hypothetical protein
MQQSLSVILFFILTLGSVGCFAGNEANNARPAIAQQEKSAPRNALDGGNSQHAGQLEACAIMDAATDPRLLASAMLAGMNPKSYLSFMQKMVDPQALRNWLSTMTPQTAMDKAYSETDPEFQTALLSRATEPKMANGWLRNILDPTYFQSALYVSSKPTEWVNVTADGRASGSMMNWFDPRTYFGWMRIMTFPRSLQASASSDAGAVVAPKPLLFTTPPQRY